MSSSRSRERPEPPPEPDINELIQNDVARIKRLLGLDVNRLALGSEVEGIVENGLFGTDDFTITGVNIIEFVNVASDIVYGTQTGAATDTVAPNQTTGLTATPISNTVINLNWNASSAIDLSLYNVYRGTSSGFTIILGTTTPTATPSTNSYSDTGRTASTAYYYKVAAVDTSTNIGALSLEANATTFPTPPAQITGLTVTPHGGSNTQLDLAWTASAAPAFSYYNVYSGPTGFTPGPSFIIAQPTTNSYANTGLNVGTTYYYKVSAVDTYSQEGTASSQVSGTTTGTTPVLPTILLHFDNNLVDSAHTDTSIAFSTTASGYTTSSAFGTHAINVNTIASPPDDFIKITNQNAYTVMDTTVGFSVSIWVYPTNISALTERRIIVESYKDTNNKWALQLDSTGKLFFFVKDAGTDYKREITGFTTGSWQHIGAVFNGSSNTVEVYRNAVAGASSTATPQYPTDPTPSITFSFRFNEAVTHYYEGRLDEFQFFNGIVLTSTQITNLMNTNAT